MTSCMKGKMTYGYGGGYTGVCEGQWMNDKRQGKGKETSANGDVYEGDFINNKKHGKGKMTYSNGTVYKEHWIRNRMIAGSQIS